ncbi:transposase [Paenibacillus oralis]|uniref:Transposase n=1 Tax=Paenibacillus oralis TaxID=2490856 RepID=A0A3P3T9I6_9BACL|nr:transposase [Paenibacillus oralis]
MSHHECSPIRHFKRPEFANTGAHPIGQKVYSARIIALGSLIIKERLGLSDRETLQIQENPYLQFFLGYTTYVDEEPFHHSLLTHFRERLGLEVLAEVNGWIAHAALQAER